MYVKVPEDLKEPLLKELRDYRLTQSLKYFPVLLLIFSGFVALALVAKGHSVIERIREDVPGSISTTVLMLIIFGVIVLLKIPVLIFILRQDYRRCELQDCLYCPRCNTVDNFDPGICPVCKTRLTGKASFYFTTSKDEEKIIRRRGLEPSQDS